MDSGAGDLPLKRYGVADALGPSQITPGNAVIGIYITSSWAKIRLPSEPGLGFAK